MSNSWFDQTRRFTHRMVRHASVTESVGEVSFAKHLEGILAELAYFQQHPQQLWLEPILGDPFRRSNVLALVRGQGQKTVVLTGHYDVVSVKTYGPLEPYAFDPDQLLPRLIADLEANARSEAEHRALRDLVSGDYEPGRGILDMKSGLAAGMSVLEAFSRLDKPVGNLLFLAVADEENNSWGARSSVAQLRDLRETLGLEIAAVINLDATSDEGDGSQGRAWYLGSVGKLLVSAYVVGIDTHAGYPLEGINPNFLLSQMVSRLECNPALADSASGETAPPPTTLKQTDLKTHYDVTTPGRAWACFNVLSHGKSAAGVLAEFRQEIQVALHEALQELRCRAASWGAQPKALEVEPYVLSFAELCQKQRMGPGFEAELAAFVAQLDTTLDLPTRSQLITDWAWGKSELIGPAVVLGFASQHYPAVLAQGQSPVTQTVRAALQRAGLETATSVYERGFFAGISDMSWFGQATALDVATVNANTPALSAHLQTAPLGLPTFNLGPWGRDYHQWLERVYAPYAYGVLPELLWRVSREILSGSTG